MVHFLAHPVCASSHRLGNVLADLLLHSDFAGFIVQFQTKLTRAENLIATLLTDVSASVRSNLGRSVIVMELLPLLIDVIQPTLRPVMLC